MRSQVQECTITQEAILVCMTTYNYINLRSLTPAKASHCSLPVEILNTVLDKDTGELLEICHLLVNPKYKDVCEKSYTTELGRLAQGIPSISEGTNTIVFITHDGIPFDQLKDITYGRICANYHPERMTTIAHDSPLAVTDSTSLETAERPPLTWSRSSSTSTVSY
jgi:hypothetical protein